MAATTSAPHLAHRVRWTYDDQGGHPYCLECDVPVPTITRVCPQCAAEFDGTSIGATLEARILCPDCSAAKAGQALAARRPRITIVCEVCGAEREVVAQTKQRTPRTCSARCRQALFRRNRAERHAIGTRDSA